MHAPMDPKRRALIAAIAASPLLAACNTKLGRARAPGFVITLTGQALIAHDICADRYSGFSDVAMEIGKGDIAITDLETVIQTPASGAPARQGTFLHAATPRELECIGEMGFGALALANNHAGDLGREGVLATREEVLRQGFAAAGSGKDLDEASNAALFTAAGQSVALVAMAAGKIQPHASAQAALAGINELRLDTQGEPNAVDIARICGSITAARKQSRHVVAYLHNHDWRGDMSQTQEWSRRFAKSCIDAGATIFFSHGAPLLHGLEIYRGAPIFYGLGSLIFHSRTAPGYYRPEVWQSAIAHLRYSNDSLSEVELVPVTLNEIGDDADHQNESRGRPRIAKGPDAVTILERIQALSEAYGTRVAIVNGRGTVKPLVSATR